MDCCKNLVMEGYVMALPVLFATVPATFGGWLASVTVTDWLIRVFKVTILLAFFGFISGVWVSFGLIMVETFDLINMLLDTIKTSTTSSSTQILQYFQCALEAVGFWEAVRAVDGIIVGALGIRLTFQVTYFLYKFAYELYIAYAMAVSK